MDAKLAEVVNHMAEQLESSANSLRELASRLNEPGKDRSERACLAGEVMMELRNLNGGMPTNLLVKYAMMEGDKV